MANSSPGWSKYGRKYKHTINYDPTIGRTIGADAMALVNCYQCLKDMDGKMEFANMGTGIGEGFENTM
jgi:hypothetical protein